MAEQIVAYPLIFTIREVIANPDFIAGVTARGRALMVREEDAWWMVGVQPGGFCNPGNTPQEAYLRFVESFKEILTDISGDLKDFDSFQKEIEEFFHETDDKKLKTWRSMAKAIREGDLKTEAPFSALPKQPAKTPPYISVELLEEEQTTFDSATTRRGTDLSVPSAA